MVVKTPLQRRIRATTYKCGVLVRRCVGIDMLPVYCLIGPRTVPLGWYLLAGLQPNVV